MVQERTESGCWKGGCIGCGVLALVLVALPVLLLRAAGRGAAEPEIEHLPLRHVVPASVAGVIDLDVTDASLEVEAAEEADDLTGEVVFDASRYRWAERFEPGDPWRYRIEVRRRWSWSLGLWIGTDNRVTLRIPAGRPLDLEGRIGVGESRLDLGGLAVRRIDLRLGIGEHTLAFLSPLVAPMERLRLRHSVGELTVRGLGNASPERAEIRQRVGELRLDLDGAWRRDARVAVRFGVGECEVNAPRRARVRTDATLAIGSRTLGRLSGGHSDAGMPTIDLEARGGIGELHGSR